MVRELLLTGGCIVTVLIQILDVSGSLIVTVFVEFLQLVGISRSYELSIHGIDLSVLVHEELFVITLDLKAARRANQEILLDYGLSEARYLGEGASNGRRARARPPCR